MDFSSLPHTLSLVAILLSVIADAAPRHCKPIPGSADWPSFQDWQDLNDTVSGRLTVPVLPGAVCHPGRIEYKGAACKIIGAQWHNESFHALDPVSTDYNDNTCPPNASAPCSAEGYPAYIIQAFDSKDVQAGVKFAAKTGVRLIVKGTGHDFPGRSSGAYALSIYTHNIRGLTYIQSDSRAVALGGIGSVKIAAGERMQDIYRFAVQKTITVVGGADPGVGIGGWITAGGHGPLTALYGLGADQVLEFEMVTPDGQFRTVSENTHCDLFWAMRGGGGSTFGVLISVTVKAYPAPLPVSTYRFNYNTTAASETFWNMNAYFHSQLPCLSDAGLMGYYFTTAFDTTETNMNLAGKINTGLWIAPGKTVNQLKAIVAPMEQKLKSAEWGDPIFIGGDAVHSPDFTTMWVESSGQPVGYPGRLGSRLLDSKALRSGYAKEAFRKAAPVPWNMPGHLVGGPGTHFPFGGIAGGSNAVLPAWREAISHVILPRIWDPLNQTQKTIVTTDLREAATQALRELAPDTGCFRNEADPTEANWRQAFHGEHYPRLLSIKKKWDPDGVFWCKACIGSELWRVMGADGQTVEGVGQDRGRLCRK